MSTAAPAAGPATAAPAPATASAPASAPAAAPDATPQPRSIKPIPDSRPRLPGVMEDGPEPATAREPDTRARDASGRFVGGGESKPVGKPEPRAVDAPDATVPDLPDAKPKIKFAGREYDDLKAIEIEYKASEGRLKPFQQKAAEYEGKLVKAAESARGWHGEAQRLAARVAELEAAAGKPSAESAATPPEGGIDWALYAEISRVANEAGEPWKAQQWLQEQVDAQIESRFNSRFEAFEAPYREREAAAAEQAEMAQTADAIVESMVAHKNPDGSPAFPELADGAQARAVGELWSSLGLDPRMALTPGGAVAAVALYRLARTMDTAAAPPSPEPNPLTPPPPDPAALAAAGLEGGRPLIPPATGRTAMDPGIARLVTGLRNTSLLNKNTGFER